MHRAESHWGSPLPPNQVENLLRRVEPFFLTGLLKYSARSHELRGFELFRVSDSPIWTRENSAIVPTGVSLCGLASTVILDILKDEFGPNIDAVKVAGMVTFRVPEVQVSPSVNIWTDHARVYYRGDDGRDYFIDGTYGQVVKEPNRIVMDLVEKENDYYQNNRYSSLRQMTETEDYKKSDFYGIFKDE